MSCSNLAPSVFRYATAIEDTGLAVAFFSRAVAAGAVLGLLENNFRLHAMTLEAHHTAQLEELGVWREASRPNASSGSSCLY